MEHAALLQVLQHPNFFDFLPTLSYIDVLSLAYAVRPIAPNFAKRLPKIKNLINRQLEALNIRVGPFWTAFQSSGAVLHGSFLLHCLLEPFREMKTYSSIFTPESDIDLLERKDSLRKTICIPCLTRIYQFNFPKTNESPEVMLRGLIHTRNPKSQNRAFRRENVLENQIAALKKRLPAGSQVSVPHIRKRHHETNALSSFLCQFGKFEDNQNKGNYFRGGMERRLTWKLGQTQFDQVTVELHPNVSLKQWLWKRADFAFGKVCFDGQMLFIADRRALIKRESPFPNILINTDFLICAQRAEKAKEKGFEVHMTGWQDLKLQKLREEEAGKIGPHGERDEW